MVYPLALGKGEVVASRAVVATNHPLASTAGAEMLARGGSAMDTAVAALFALTVVEPIMVGICGAGFFLIRDAAGQLVTLDVYACCPDAATPDMFTPIAALNEWRPEGDENRVGHKAVGVPGALAGWCTALDRFGLLTLPEVLAPAIRFGDAGYPASPYLVAAIRDTAHLAGRRHAGRHRWRGRPDGGCIAGAVIGAGARTLQMAPCTGTNGDFVGPPEEAFRVWAEVYLS